MLIQLSYHEEEDLIFDEVAGLPTVTGMALALGVWVHVQERIVTIEEAMLTFNASQAVILEALDYHPLLEYDGAHILINHG